MSEENQQDGTEGNSGCLLGSVIAVVVVVVMFLTGGFAIVDSGCTLPVDVVVFNEMCLFGSFGGSLGMTLIATVALGAVGLVLTILLALLRKLFGG
jgi:hypothetical protein